MKDHSQEWSRRDFLRIGAAAGAGASLTASPAAAQVDLYNLVPRFDRRQIDEKDLVETSLAQQLRRQRLDVVGSGDEENRCAMFLHPRQKRAEHPLA